MELIGDKDNSTFTLCIVKEQHSYSQLRQGKVLKNEWKHMVPLFILH